MNGWVALALLVAFEAGWLASRVSASVRKQWRSGKTVREIVTPKREQRRPPKPTEVP